MELLAGAAGDAGVARLRRLLGRFELLGLEVWPTTRRLRISTDVAAFAGETVRKLTDCLIAVVAIRHGAALLHRDQDFDVIARHTSLQVAGS